MGGWGRVLLVAMAALWAVEAVAQPPDKPLFAADPIELFSAVTAAVADPKPAWVGDANVIMLQVCVAAGDCTDLSLVPEGRVPNTGGYSPIPPPGEPAEEAPITHDDVPAGECRSWSINPGHRFFRLRPATVDDCTVSAWLHLMD